MSPQPTRTNRPSRPAGKPRKAPPVGKTKSSTVKQREAARRALAASAHTRATQRRRMLTVLVPVGAVIAVLIAFIAIRAGTSADHSGKKSRAAEAAVVAAVTGVPATALDAAGAGAGTQNDALAAITGDALTADGKPRVLYVGAEYCPYCAAERWPLIVALSRFGTWSGLAYSYSGAAPEVFPNTPTFTFHGAKYTSRWISFTGVETQSNQEKHGAWEPLDKLSAADAAIMRQHDPEGSVPYTNLAGRFVISGATYDPGVLTGTHAQIAATLADPSTKSGKAIDAAANVITAALCRSTNQQPAAVCTSAGVQAAAKALPGGS